MYTIFSEKGTIDNLKIGLIGDLKYGRTVQSLVKTLAIHGASFVFISSEYLKIPTALREFIEQNGNEYIEYDRVDEDHLKELDVLYVTRVQRERFDSYDQYLENKDHCYLDIKHISDDSNFIILHPLPRVDEMDKSIDELPCAKYFEQISYSVPIRMALLNLLLRDKK